MSNILRLTVIGLMVVCVAALGLLGLALLRPAAHPVPLIAARPVAQDYILAAHALPAGTLTRDTDFIAGPLPGPGPAPPGAMLAQPAAFASLRGALLRSYVEAGQPVSDLAVLRPRDRGFLATVLAPGMRAVSIGVNAVTGVAGLVWPGDHVDVILTQQLQDEPVARRVWSEAVLTDVRVIAVDQQITQGAPADASAAGNRARTITLEVTPADAEKVTVAAELGQLSLTIRAAQEPEGAMMARAAPTFGADVSAALANSEKPIGTTVRVIQGDRRETVTFR